MRVTAVILGGCQSGDVDLCTNMGRKNKIISININSPGQSSSLWQKKNEGENESILNST